MTDAIRFNPRVPDPACVVKGRDEGYRKCLCLLSFEGRDAPLYFVVESGSEFPATREELLASRRFCFEEHTCPENWLRVEMICHKSDTDPHDAFKFVDAVWMTMDYEDCDSPEEYLKAVFPQLDCTT